MTIMWRMKRDEWRQEIKRLEKVLWDTNDPADKQAFADALATMAAEPVAPTKVDALTSALILKVAAALERAGETSADALRLAEESVGAVAEPVEGAELAKAWAERALNPLLWTREMSEAWHRALPDVDKAFERLREAAMANFKPTGEPVAPAKVEAACASCADDFAAMMGNGTGELEPGQRFRQLSRKIRSGESDATPCRRCGMLGRDLDAEGAERCTYCGEFDPDLRLAAHQTDAWVEKLRGRTVTISDSPYGDIDRAIAWVYGVGLGQALAVSKVAEPALAAPKAGAGESK